MNNRQPGKWIVAVGGLLITLAPTNRADACVDMTSLVIGGAAALLAPGDIGVALPTAAGSAPNLVIGWSWQIPLGDGGGLAGRPEPHRFVLGVDLLPHSDGASWRGRLGYRYGRRHAFAGAGVGFDAAGVNLSPEVGAKFLHLEARATGLVDMSMHLLARAEIAPESGHVRGATILLGWNLF